MTTTPPLPTVRCPFERRKSRFAMQVTQRTNQWLAETGMLGDPAQLAAYQAMRFGEFAAQVYPEAPVEQLMLAAQWLAWLFLVDDVYLDESEIGGDPAALSQIFIEFHRFLYPPHLPATPPSPRPRSQDPFAQVLGALLDRTRAVTTDSQFQRLTTDLTVALHTVLMETCWAVLQKAPSLSQYRVTRQHSGAVLLCIHLIHLFDGYELPPAEAEHPHVRALTGAALNVIYWSNDIFSCFKETTRSCYDLNLPDVLRRHHGFSERDALDEAIRMYDEELDYYLRMEDTLRPAASPLLRRYMDGLRAWMQGNHHWYLESGRLSGAGGHEILGVE